MLQILTWALRIAFFLLLLFFAVKNTETVTVDLLTFTTTLPMVVVILGSFSLGCLMGLLALVGRVFRQYREIGKLKKQLNKLMVADKIDITKAANVERKPLEGSALEISQDEPNPVS